jgi:hypothetical protein
MHNITVGSNTKLRASGSKTLLVHRQALKPSHQIDDLPLTASCFLFSDKLKIHITKKRKNKKNNIRFFLFMLFSNDGRNLCMNKSPASGNPLHTSFLLYDLLKADTARSVIPEMSEDSVKAYTASAIR